MTEYITREAALYATGVDRSNWTSPNNTEAWWACGEMRDAIREEIENIPSVSVDFERHGQWLPDGDKVFCSECRFSVSGEYVPKVFMYCPHCGAKMNEVDE